MNRIISVIFLLIIPYTAVYGQYDEKSFSVTLNGVYTTTAKIYLKPFSSDPILRNNSFPLEDILNGAVEFKYRVTDPLIAGISVEYMRAADSGPNLTVFDGSSTRTIMVEDGFELIPVELTFYYILPFSTEKFKFLMGGGAGLYFGSHIRKAGNISVSTEERKTAYGIHVTGSVDYEFIEDTFVHFEMKFRDPQFTIKSRYPQDTFIYEGRTIRLAQDTFDSKINVDGVTFILGFSRQF